MNERNWLRYLLVAMLLTGIGFAWYWRDSFSPQAINDWLQQLGWIAPLVFVAGYAVATVFFLPGVVFTLAGGALFGPLLGVVYNLAGATIGATLAFLTARYLASDWVARRSGRHLRQLVEGVEEEGWRFVAFTRLVPLFPFNLLNYAFGLTRIRLSHYVIATFIFMAPGGAAYTYLGYAGREIAVGGEALIRKGLIALALLASIAFGSRIYLRWRRRRRGQQA